MKKCVGWDLEIHQEIREGLDWKDARPLGITCAAAYLSDSDIPLVWYAGQNSLEQEHLEFGEYNFTGGVPTKDRMNVGEVQKMVSDLVNLSEEGYEIVTWNGLQFDFDVLAEESEQYEVCVDLAWKHIDIMFQFFCKQGYPVGLKYASQLMLKSDKTEGMTGALAPEMWQGSDADRLKTIEYVIQDAKLTVDLALEIEKQKGLFGWITKKGRPKWVRLGELVSCKEASEFVEVDTSWMSRPIKREGFYEWLLKKN